MKVLVVDLAKCNGCRCCQLACKDEHCGNDWSPYAKPQPMSGQFWCDVKEEERGRVPVVRVAYTPVFCGHCDECPLIDAAPECVSRNEDGFVMIDPETSRGRNDLASLCPHGRVFFNDELDIPQKCTGCAHLLDNGWSEPRCVDACATGALRFGDAEDFAAEIAAARREGMPGDKLASAAQAGDATAIADLSAATGSHVYYLNVPKRWIAGTVADREINEVIIGAPVTVFSEDGAVAARGETDWAGDFRFSDCERALYRVRIEPDGYDPIELTADCRERDVVFDDIFVKGGNSN